MLRGLSVKKGDFYESQLETLTVLFEGENKGVYPWVYGELCKGKSAMGPKLVNTLHHVTLSKIDEDGLVRFQHVKEVMHV